MNSVVYNESATATARTFCVQMTAARLSALIIPVLVLMASCARQQTDKPPERGSPVRYSSPKAVFDFFRQARSKGDWRSCFHCLTPEEQNDSIFEIFFACAESGSDQAAAICNRYIADREKLNDDYEKRYKEKYGVDVSTVREKQQSDAAPASSSDRDLLRDTVCEHVRDKAGFYEAVSNLLATDDSRSPIGDLEELTIDGDTATGHAEMIISHLESLAGEPSHRVEDKVPQTFRFRRVNGDWFIDTP